MERTLVLLKPEAVERGICGEIIMRFERRGLKIVGMKMLRMTKEMAREHYRVHEGKPFFEGLVEHITSGPIVAMVLEGPDVVRVVRDMMGATDPLKSPPGTIRGDYGLDIGRNIIHGSDSRETAEREIKLFFGEDEIFPR